MTRLRAVAGAVVCGLVLLTVGAVLAVTRYLSAGSGQPPASSGAATHTGPGPGLGRRDAIAAEPMLAVPSSAATATSDAGVTGEEPVRLPYSRRTGNRGVPSGFGRTPLGAAAQLAALEATALGSGNPAEADALRAAWSLKRPVGPWDVSDQLRQFLDTVSGVQDGQIGLSADPVGVIVKGTDGPNWAVVCVLLDVQARVQTKTAHAAYGHCERMTWRGGRWVIAPGAPPAPAPSTWPHTHLAAKAGWRPVTASPAG